jgi:DNA mismatch repair ATPase MutS
VAASGRAQALDDRTADDLHLGAVFAQLDRTESALGQQALYHRLQTGPATTRNAIALLALTGASEALILDARAIATELDGQRRPVREAT